MHLWSYHSLNLLRLLGHDCCFPLSLYPLFAEMLSCVEPALKTASGAPHARSNFCRMMPLSEARAHIATFVLQTQSRALSSARTMLNQCYCFSLATSSLPFYILKKKPLVRNRNAQCGCNNSSENSYCQIHIGLHHITQQLSHIVRKNSLTFQEIVCKVHLVCSGFRQLVERQ